MRRTDPGKNFRESSLQPFASQGGLYVRASFRQLSEIALSFVLRFGTCNRLHIH